MSDPLSEQYTREKAKLISGLALLGQMDRMRRVVAVQLTAQTNALRTASLELDVEGLDRWIRRVKIVRAAAIGVGVGAILGPAVLPFLKGVAGSYASVLFMGGMAVGSGVVQTLVSGSGELPGRSAAVELLDIAVSASFEDKLRFLPLETKNLMYVTDESQYDFIVRLGSYAEQQARTLGAATSAQLAAAKAKWLEHYWSERHQEIQHWMMSRRNGLHQEVLRLRGVVEQLERQMRVQGPPVPAKSR